MARDDAFWCLTALAEAVASHFVSENMLQGAVADCECVLVCFLDMLLMAPVDMVNIPLFRWFYASLVLQDFFHQQ